MLNKTGAPNEGFFLNTLKTLFRLSRVLLVCYTVFFSVVTQRSSPQGRGPLRDDTKNGCVADKSTFRSLEKHSKIFYRGGSRIFFRRRCTRLLLYFNSNKPHSFFFLQNTSCLGKPQVISGGEGAHPLHPPPRSAPALSGAVKLASVRSS